MNYRLIIYLALSLIVTVIIIGCEAGDPTVLPTETIKVTELKATQTSIAIGDTTTLAALVDYSGDTTVLMYTWTTTGGNVQGSSNKVTYKAPDKPGIYSISLKVTDGAISSGKTIDITVTQKSSEISLTIGSNTYWPATDEKDKLAYSAKITKLSGVKVLLHIDITQKNDKFDAFLSIQIGQNVVLQEMAIGNEIPSTGERTIRDIDISSAIKSPGNYIITFYIRPGNRAQNGWLLNEAKIIGAEGFSEQQ